MRRCLKADTASWSAKNEKTAVDFDLCRGTAADRLPGGICGPAAGGFVGTDGADRAAAHGDTYAGTYAQAHAAAKGDACACTHAGTKAYGHTGPFPYVHGHAKPNTDANAFP